MKQIFLLCCIVAFSFVGAQAQSTQSVADIKNTFSSKITQMQAFVSANDSVHAKAVFNDLKLMMEQELGTVKGQIGTASNEAEKNAAMARIRQQQTYYSHIMAAAHQNFASYYADINTGLQNFLQTY